MREFLTRTSTLWTLAILMVLISIGFWQIMRAYDFMLIDEMWEPQKIREHIEQLSGEQKQVHMWTTGTLDVAFPLVYGGLFVGLVWRFFGRLGRLLAIPGLLVIPVDLTEGVVQIMALGGNDAVVFHKLWVTPIKLGLFIAAGVFALIAVGVAIRRKYSGSAAL